MESMHTEQAASPSINLAPGLARQRLQEGLAHLQQHCIQVDEEAVWRCMSVVHLHLGPLLGVPLQADANPLQHGFPCVLLTFSQTSGAAYCLGALFRKNPLMPF